MISGDASLRSEDVTLSLFDVHGHHISWQPVYG